MELIARILRTSAVLWLLMVICAVFGAYSVPVFAGCDDHFRLMVRAGMETGFFSVEQLQGMSVDELKTLHAKYARLLDELNATDKAVRTVKVENEIRNVKQYIWACERAMDRRAGKLVSDPNQHARLKILRVKVTGKSWAQVRDEIERELRTLSLPTERQLLRYFASAREDLVREFGNDRHGIEFDHEMAWDKFNQEHILRERGLLPGDAVFGELFKYWFEMKAGLPSDFESDFMHGGRSIAVYDIEAMEEQDLYASDLFIFKNRNEKSRAVVAILRPIR